MSKVTLIQEIVDYLNRQKALGRKRVYRTAIYAVIEDRHGCNTIGNGIAITRGLLSQAAQMTGGTYFPAKNGNSKVVF